MLRDEPKAKYVNNAESPVFRKRSLLFGLHRARPVIREQRTAVVVEGYFDVIALHGAGVSGRGGARGGGGWGHGAAVLTCWCGCGGRCGMRWAVWARR